MTEKEIMRKASRFCHEISCAGVKEYPRTYPACREDCDDFQTVVEEVMEKYND